MCIGSSLENEKRVYSFFKGSNKRGNKIGGQGMGLWVQIFTSQHFVIFCKFLKFSCFSFRLSKVHIKMYASEWGLGVCVCVCVCVCMHIYTYT